MKHFLQGRFHKFTEINRKYSTPRIKQTRLVSIALLMLRLYLLVLVGVLFYKFFTTVVK